MSEILEKAGEECDKVEYEQLQKVMMAGKQDIERIGFRSAELKLFDIR